MPCMSILLPKVVSEAVTDPVSEGTADSVSLQIWRCGVASKIAEPAGRFSASIEVCQHLSERKTSRSEANCTRDALVH